MTQVEEIQRQLSRLPPDKQREVLDFVSFLYQQVTSAPRQLQRHSLREHPAFGSWRLRKVDALQYQRRLRSEWD